MKDKASPIEDAGYIEIKRLLGCEATGDHLLLQDPSTGRLVMKKIFHINDMERAKRMLAKFEGRKANGCSYLIECLDYSFKTKTRLCVKYFVMCVYYEYPLYDLERLFKARTSEGRPFYHEELMFLFYHILEALCHLEGLSSAHGYLQLSSIFYDTESQRYKLCENFGMMHPYEQYVGAFFNSNGYKTFAPEVLQAMQVGSKQAFDLAKADTYNLGVILLSLGNMAKPIELYDTSFYKVSDYGQEKLMGGFVGRYESDNPLLVEIVKELLVRDQAVRLTPRQVKAKFPSFEQFLEVYEKSRVHASKKISAVNETHMDSFIKNNASLRNMAMSQSLNQVITIKGKGFFDFD